jgi:predicted TPR repeat methyltransferase
MYAEGVVWRGLESHTGKNKVSLTSKVHLYYTAPNNRELAERYDIWAPDYDREMEVLFGYSGPDRGAETLARYASRNDQILDAGAGTGLVGQALFRLGYRNLVGIDNSAGMLSRAREKKAYRALYQKDLGQPLGFATASFCAVISVGVFTYGHAPVSCLDRLICITKPGGHVIFSLRPDFYECSGFRDELNSLETRKRWELVEVGEEFSCFPKCDPDVLLKFWVYRVK